MCSYRQTPARSSLEIPSNSPRCALLLLAFVKSISLASSDAVLCGAASGEAEADVTCAGRALEGSTSDAAYLLQLNLNMVLKYSLSSQSNIPNRAASVSENHEPRSAVGELGKEAEELVRTLDTPAASSRTALYSVYVEAKDALYMNGQVHRSGEELLLSALRLKCSAARRGSRLPFHLITAGVEDPQRLQLLEKFGYVIENRTKDIDRMRNTYRPVYTGEEARNEGRWWALDNDVQNRSDGWTTYFKFFAFNATLFDHVMVSDLDVCFTETPDNVLANIPLGETFMASPERATRKYDGINSHLMIVKPSTETFNAILERAKSGEYIPYTNGDQDVLEFMYPPHLFAKQDMNDIVRHDHYLPLLGSETCTVNHLSSLPSPTCDDFWEMCVRGSGRC